MNGLILIAVLLLGIILIKIFWIYTEIKYFKNRLNLKMLKTNSVEAVILILQIVAALLLPIPNNTAGEFIRILGIIMYVTGMIAALWARFTMNKVWGIPGEHAAQQNELITTGPFALSRNPIYFGFVLIYFGFAFAIGSWLFFLRIPLLLYFYRSAKKEEKLLEKRFGEKYLKYKASVPLIF